MLDDLAQFVDEILPSERAGKSLTNRNSTRRLKWAFSQKKKAKRLQKGLRAIRLNVSILLAAKSTYVTFAFLPCNRSLYLVCSSADNHSVHLILNRVSVQNADSRPNAALIAAANIADEQALKSSASSRVAVYLHKRRHSACMSDCRCKCHNKACRQTPAFLGGILGKLLVGYSGTLVGIDECSSTCRNNAVFNIQVTYVFPGWFVAKAISMSFWRTHQSPLTVFLAVRNYTEDRQLFHHIRSEDLDGVRYLLQHKRVSPNDLETSRGGTALHVRSLQHCD